MNSIDLQILFPRNNGLRMVTCGIQGQRCTIGYQGSIWLSRASLGYHGENRSYHGDSAKLRFLKTGLSLGNILSLIPYHGGLGYPSVTGYPAGGLGYPLEYPQRPAAFMLCSQPSYPQPYTQPRVFGYPCGYRYPAGFRYPALRYPCPQLVYSPHLCYRCLDRHGLSGHYHYHLWAH